MTAATRNAPPSVIVHTTHLMAWPGGDHTVCLAATNDGLTIRTPGLTPDQAEAFAALIRDVASRCREARAAAVATASAAPVPAAPPPPNRTPAPPTPAPPAAPRTSRLI